MKISYFDSYAVIGRRGYQDSAEKWTAEDLLSEMKYCGINAALVSHSLAYHYDPMYGNKLLLEELNKDSRFFGMWVLAPPGVFDMPETDEILKLIKKHNIKAVKLAPSKHAFDLSQEITCGFVRKLAQNKIPLFIEADEKENPLFFHDLECMMEKCSNPVITVQGLKWKENRRLWMLLKTFSNLRIEFSNLQSNRLIEEFMKEFGAERLLFGSGALAKSPGASKAFIDYSEISRQEKALIASGNLMKLLGIKNIPSVSGSKNRSPLMKRIFSGKSLASINIIDSHAHILHENGMGSGNVIMPYGDGMGIIGRNKTMGIHKTCVSSWLGILSDTEKGNEVTLDAMRKYPKDFIGYICIDPKIGDVGEQVIKWRKKHPGFIGLKPYQPFLKISYSSPLLESAWKQTERWNMFVLIHGNHDAIPPLAEKYPGTTWIIAHCGSSFDVARSCCKIAEKHKNVFLEITNTSVCLGIIEYMAETIGSERVLFGSDQPMRDPAPQFGWVTYSHLSDSDKENILGKNMLKIIEKVKQI